VVSISRFLNNAHLIQREKIFVFLRTFRQHLVKSLIWSQNKSARFETSLDTERGYKVIRVTGFREKWDVFSNDQHISKQISLHGEFDFYKLVRAHALISPSNRQPILIDVGANIGPICVPAISRGFFREALALEAGTDFAELLKRNLALNEIQKSVEVLNVAVGDVDFGNVSLLIEGDNFGASRVLGSESLSKSLVPLRTLDSLVRKPEEVGLIFMDIEGFEGRAILGATKLIDSGVPLLIEFSPQLLIEHTSKEQFCESLSTYSFFVSVNDPFLIRYPIEKLGQVWDWYFEEPSGWQTDIIFLKN